MLQFFNFVRTKHQSLQMPKARQMRQMLTRDAVEDHIQSDQRGQIGKVLKRQYSAIIECEHLQKPESLELLPYISCEVPSETDRNDVDHVDHVRWGALGLVSDRADEFLGVRVGRWKRC